LTFLDVMKRVVKGCRVVAVLCALAGVAACATNGTPAAAERLAHSADAFVTTACSSPTDACLDVRYFPAAGRFAEQALDFREMVDSGTPQQILSSFEHLWRDYHKLRHEVSRSGNEPLVAEFESTTRAFRQVQQCVKQWYSDRDTLLLVRGGYAYDPYYN